MSADRDREAWRRRSDEPGSGSRGPNPPARERSDANSGSIWTARGAVVRRELRSLRSEKTIVLAIAIQLFIAAFSSFLVVGLVTMYDPSGVDGHEMEVAVTGEDPDELLSVSSRQDGLTPVSYDDRSQAHADFDTGQVVAVLDANRDDDDRLVVRTTVPDEGLATTLLVVQLRDALETVEHQERLENEDRLAETPLAVPQAIDASPYVGFTYTILLPLLLFLPVFLSGSILVDSLIEERQRGTLELLRVAPLSFVDVVDAKLLATAALAPIQALAWLALLALNGTAIANPLALVAFVFALALLVVAVAAATALAAPDRRQAQLLYSIGIVAALVVSVGLPEHPANTVAKFALGNPTTTTWLLLALYCLLAAVALSLLRRGVRWLEPESL
ncbi:ABC transporter permease [Natrarchaeobaculum sulfurireducens]|uniref:ABC transporter permease n=1 Tax=Natrarchaeobaculum sulfurireducens TaxID=2044521 RepID=UPI000E3DE316